MLKRTIGCLVILVLATSCTGGSEEASNAGNADVSVVSAGAGGGGTTDTEAESEVSTSSEASTTAPPTTAVATTAAPTTTQATTQTTGAPTTAPTTVPTDGTIIRSESAAFTSPSGNIACFVDRVGGASCYIMEKQWTIDPPSGCQDDFGNALSVGSSGAVFSCYTDFSWDFNAAPLAYGDAVATGEFICESAQSGVTCSNGAGGGFKVARASADLF